MWNLLKLIKMNLPLKKKEIIKYIINIFILNISKFQNSAVGKISFQILIFRFLNFNAWRIIL